MSIVSLTATSTAIACPSFEVMRAGSMTAGSYRVLIVSMRGSVRIGTSAASTAARKSGSFALSVSLEKISVNVEPPTMGSSCSMRRDARPDSAVSMKPPLSSLPPRPAMKPDARRSAIETARTGQRCRYTKRPQAANTLRSSHLEMREAERRDRDPRPADHRRRLHDHGFRRRRRVVAQGEHLTAVVLIDGDDAVREDPVGQRHRHEVSDAHGPGGHRRHEYQRADRQDRFSGSAHHDIRRETHEADSDKAQGQGDDRRGHGDRDDGRERVRYSADGTIRHPA